MPYQAALHYDLPIWDENENGRALREVRQGSLENPYANYSALLSHLLALATDAPLAELQRFADCGACRIEAPGSPWSRYSLLLLQGTLGPEKPGWYDFDPADFQSLLQHPLVQPCFDGEAYRHIDYYLTALAELRLLRELPQSRPMLQQLWRDEDLPDFYWETFPLRGILAEAYQLLGWAWFCPDAERDPLHYRGGLLAALALLTRHPERESEIRADLVALYDQLILTAGEQLNAPLVAELRSSIQDAIHQLAAGES